MSLKAEEIFNVPHVRSHRVHGTACSVYRLSKIVQIASWRFGTSGKQKKGRQHIEFGFGLKWAFLARTATVDSDSIEALRLSIPVTLKE